MMLNTLSQEEVSKILEIQRLIRRLADVDYECYYEKIDLIQFWQKYLWDRMSSLSNENKNIKRSKQ